MGIRNLAARGLSFAHLAGINSRAARAEDDQRDDEDERAEEDEQEEQDRDDGDSGSKGKKGKRAEDDDRDDKDAEDDELEEDDSGKGKKGKKAADDEDDERAEDEDEDDEQASGKSAVARARRTERARCAAIMGHKAAGRNVALAASLAFNTSMSSQEAIAVLKATPGNSASADRSDRAARNPQLGAGGEMARNPQRESASGWDRAFSKASGKRS